MAATHASKDWGYHYYHIRDQFGTTLTCLACSIPSSGFFNVEASNNELTTGISVVAADGELDDVRQVRLEGVTSAVPELA